MLTIGSLEDKYEKLECRVEKLEERPTKPDANIETIVRDEIKEINDVESRKLNLICFNLPESNKTVTEEKRDDDIKQLKSLVENDMGIGDKGFVLENLVRLGNRDVQNEPHKIRPLKFRVQSFDIKRQILQGNAALKTHAIESKRKVFVTPDLTRKQREESYKLREELRYRKFVMHESNLKISRGRIVSTTNPPRTNDPQEPVTGANSTNFPVHRPRTFRSTTVNVGRESPPPRLFQTN